MEYFGKVGFYKEVMFKALDEEKMAIKIGARPFGDPNFRIKPVNAG
jgi:hypothetical protein